MKQYQSGAKYMAECRPSDMNLPSSWYQEVVGTAGQKSIVFARSKTKEEIKKIMSEIRPPTEEEKSMYSKFRYGA